MTAARACRKCGEAFSGPRCRACNRAWREANRERIAANAAARRPRRRERAREIDRAWRKTSRGRAAIARTHERERLAGRTRAREAVQYALRSGQLTRGRCEVCLDPRTEAHHHLGYDPSHWLDVRWLCKAHHAAEHSTSRSAGHFVAAPGVGGSAERPAVPEAEQAELGF